MDFKSRVVGKDRIVCDPGGQQIWIAWVVAGDMPNGTTAYSPRLARRMCPAVVW